MLCPILWRFAEVLDRETGKVFEEVIPGPVWSILKGLYATSACGVVAAHPFRCCLRRITQHAGRKMRSPSSKKDIQKFVDVYRIDLDEVLLPLEKFVSMNDFFYTRAEASGSPDPQSSGCWSFCQLRRLQGNYFPNPRGSDQNMDQGLEVFPCGAARRCRSKALPAKARLLLCRRVPPGATGLPSLPLSVRPRGGDRPKFPGRRVLFSQPLSRQQSQYRRPYRELQI
ncbi:unnamed protein product, partial [Durusdinium trenchii]